MYHTKQKSIFFALIFGLAASIVPAIAPTNVSAEESFAMGVSSSDEFVNDLHAGQIAEREFLVVNQGFDPFDIEVEVAPYYGGSAVSDVDGTAMETHTQIQRWITLETTEATIQPGESLPIKYTITVPSDPPSGGQNAVINVVSNPKGAGGVGLGKAIGHTVHANIVDGDTKVEAELKVHNVPAFLFAGPISSTIRIDNTGNTDVPAKFTFSVYNFFTGDMVYTYDIPRIMSFPKSKVTKNLNWAGTPLLGIFRVDSIVEMLGETHLVQQTVIILPVFVIILLILIISLVVVLLVNRAKARKSKLPNSGSAA